MGDCAGCSVEPESSAARVGSACTQPVDRWAAALPRTLPAHEPRSGEHLWAGSQKLAAFPNLPSPGISEVTLGTHVLLPGSLGAGGRNALLSYSTGHRNASQHLIQHLDRPRWSQGQWVLTLHCPSSPGAPSQPRSMGSSR